MDEIPKIEHNDSERPNVIHISQIVQMSLWHMAA